MLDSFRRSAQGPLAKARLRARVSDEAFRDQVVSFGEGVRVLVAEYEGVVQASAVIPFSAHTAYYMHGGSIANPLTGASNFLHWEAFRLFRDLGVRRYDFFGSRIGAEPGSKAEGITKFKERFGGELVRGYMWKLALRPLKTRLYSMVVRIRSGGDVVDQEAHRLQAGSDAAQSA
jgi:lipid II:glycine glycyltransferase (peptidoglycan interpeptide bridge formation enzyme)